MVRHILFLTRPRTLLQDTVSYCQDPAVKLESTVRAGQCQKSSVVLRCLFLLLAIRRWLTREKCKKAMQERLLCSSFVFVQS